MSERSQDLESFRENFIQQLHESQPQLTGYQDFIHFWKTVEKEATQTEDLSKLEGWVKDLSRDKEEVKMMKEQVETMDERDPMSDQLLQILRMLLDFLEGIEKRVRRVRDDRRSYLQALLWKGGPGMKPKETPDTEKKDEKKGDAVQTALLNTPKDAIKQTPPELKPEKKMQR